MGKNKRGICMADGGITETPEQLMARMAAKYGVSASSPPGQQPTPVATPIPKPATEPTNPGVGTGILNVLKGRHAQIDKAAGYANGGIAGHVKFEGKGGPRDDQIPVKVAGQEINVSNKEQALIIPAKTAANAQAMAAIKQIIADSNDGRQPDMGHGDANFAEGGLLDEEARKMSYQGVTGIQAPSPTPVPAAQTGGDAWSLGKSGPGATLQVTTGDAARLPAPVVQQGVDTMRGQLAKPAVPASPQSAPATPITSQGGIAARPWYAGTSTMDDRSGLEMERYRRSEASAAGVMNDPVKSALQFGVVGAAQSQAAKPAAAPANASPIAGQTEFKADPFGSTPDKLMAENSDGQFMTGKNGAAPDSSGGGFTQKGVSYNVNPSSQEGITKVTATGKNPLYTNIRPEDATAMLKNQMVGGDAASVQEGLDRYARANAITQSIIDKQPQGGIGILNDPNNVDAANAEKTARWRQDDLIAKSRSLPAAGQLANTLAQGETQGAIEASRSATAQRGQDITSGITARGQDLTAKTESGRQAAESPLKQAQAEGIMAQTDSARMLADLQKKALAGDAQAAASYRALTGKSAPASDRYMTVQGGEEIGPDGMTKIKRPGGVFDAQTQKFVPMDGGGQPKQQQAPTSAVDYLKKNPAQAEAFKAKYGYLPEGF